MYFIKRGDAYIDVAGSSFRDLLARRHPAVPGETATLADWINHLSTIFPEVRLKRYLEMRGADAGPWAKLCALPALWVGLLYDTQALMPPVSSPRTGRPRSARPCVMRCRGLG